MKKAFFSVILALAVSGCAVAVRTEGQKIDKSMVMELKPGATTRQAVLEKFGNPTEISFENSEEKLVYVFKEKKVPSYFGGLVELEAKKNEAVTMLELVLKNDVVYSYRYTSEH